MDASTTAPIRVTTVTVDDAKPSGTTHTGQFITGVRSVLMRVMVSGCSRAIDLTIHPDSPRFGWVVSDRLNQSTLDALGLTKNDRLELANVTFRESSNYVMVVKKSNGTVLKKSFFVQSLTLFRA